MTHDLYKQLDYFSTHKPNKIAIIDSDLEASQLTFKGLLSLINIKMRQLKKL